MYALLLCSHKPRITPQPRPSPTPSWRTGANAAGCSVVLGGWDPTKLSLILQRKSDGFIHAEPFLTLPKFPDYFSLTFSICKMG